MSGKQGHCVCTMTAVFGCQVVEAHSRHQLEREAVQRDNAQQRRELAEEERKAALEKVRDWLQEWSQELQAMIPTPRTSALTKSQHSANSQGC